MSNTKKEIKLRVPDTVQAGTYANNTLVSHTREEFLLDFMMVAPPGGTVVSRIIVSPSHLKRMILTMQGNLQKYEASYGPIEPHDPQQMTMGFSG